MFSLMEFIAKNKKKYFISFNLIYFLSFRNRLTVMITFLLEELGIFIFIYYFNAESISDQSFADVSSSNITWCLWHVELNGIYSKYKNKNPINYLSENRSTQRKTTIGKARTDYFSLSLFLYLESLLGLLWYFYFWSNEALSPSKYLGCQLKSVANFIK